MPLAKIFNLFRKKRNKTSKSSKRTGLKDKGKIKSSLRDGAAKQKRKVASRSTPEKKKKKEVAVATIIHRFSKIRVAILKMGGSLNTGDTIHIKGHTTDFTQKVASMQINHEQIAIAKKGQEIGLLVKGKVREADTVYRVL